MNPAVVRADDHMAVRGGGSPWFETRAGLFVAGEATDTKLRSFK